MPLPKTFISYHSGRPEKILHASYLGKGIFGSAYKFQDPHYPNQHLVCKHIEVTNKGFFIDQCDKHTVLESTIKELYALETMGYLKGYQRNGNDYYIVMQYFENNPNYIKNTEEDFFALRDCHRKGIAHFDSHQENIIHDNSGKSRMIDFGLSEKATFFNTYVDIHFFNIRLNSRLIKPFNLFVKDSLSLLRRNPLYLIKNGLWFGAMLYGSMYGFAILGISSQMMQSYFITLYFHQNFQELTSIMQMVSKTYKMGELSYPLYFISKGALNISNLSIIGTHLNQLGGYAAIKFFSKIATIGAKFGFTAAKTALQANPVENYFNIALLYYPIKDSLQFIDDNLIKPIEPESVTHLRADLYFKYHPSLYVKAGLSHTQDAAVNLASKIRRPSFSPG